MDETRVDIRPRKGEEGPEWHTEMEILIRTWPNLLVELKKRMKEPVQRLFASANSQAVSSPEDLEKSIDDALSKMGKDPATQSQCISLILDHAQEVTTPQLEKLITVFPHSLGLQKVLALIFDKQKNTVPIEHLALVATTPEWKRFFWCELLRHSTHLTLVQALRQCRTLAEEYPQEAVEAFEGFLKKVPFSEAAVLSVYRQDQNFLSSAGGAAVRLLLIQELSRFYAERYKTPENLLGAYKACSSRSEENTLRQSAFLEAMLRKGTLARYLAIDPDLERKDFCTLFNEAEQRQAVDVVTGNNMPDEDEGKPFVN